MVYSLLTCPIFIGDGDANEETINATITRTITTALQAELSMRQIKDSLRVSLGAVQKVISKAEAQGLSWASIEQLDDQQLARLFYPEADTRVSATLQLPDWVEVPTNNLIR